MLKRVNVNYKHTVSVKMDGDPHSFQMLYYTHGTGR